jgi:serpin B
MSSYSLVSALGMLLNGASGDTANQVLSSFGLEEEKDFIQNYKLVANQLKSNENFKLNSANRVYYQHNWEINHNYTKSTKEHFLAGPEKVDFSIGTAPAIINKWIEDQTNDKIKDLVPADLDPSTVLVLVNAIHFKGDWDEKI